MYVIDTCISICVYTFCYCNAILWLLGETNTWSERETQMQVLLDAKGHKIEELQYALSDLTESSEREIRILKHQLLMMTGLVYDCAAVCFLMPHVY